MGIGGYSRAKFLILGAGIALAVLGTPRQALADCANPAAPEGRLIYNSTSKVVQFCDGTNWIGMGGGGGGGGASALVGLSDVDAASAGTGHVLVYNAVSGNWESVAVGSDTQIIFNDGGALSGNAGFVFDKNNVRIGVGVATPAQAIDVAGLMTSDGLLLKSVAGDPPTMAGAPNLGDLADVDTSGAADGLVLKYNGTSSAWEAASGGSASQWTDAGSDIYFSGGEVGIGTATPDGALHILMPGTGRNLILDKTTTNPQLVFANAGVVKWGIYNEVSTDTLNFRNWDDAVTHMTITNDGNVGIGTTSPGYKLEVSGANSQVIGLTSTSGTQYAGLRLEGNSRTWTLMNRSDLSGGFSIADETAGANRFVINASGNIGIGTTSPAGKLDVNGSIVAGSMGPNGSWTNTLSGTHLSSSGYLWLARAAASLYIQQLSGSGLVVAFASGQTHVGGISVNASSTAYNTTSDYRLKENVTPIDQALDRVSALKPMRFNFRNDPDNVIDGFLAHEVQAVAPYAATGEKDAFDDAGEPIYQQVDYGKLTPLLAAAIKELKADNDNLRAAGESHAAELHALREELDALKSAIGH